MLKVLKVRNVRTPERGTELSAGIDLFVPSDLTTNDLVAIQNKEVKQDIHITAMAKTGLIDEIILDPQKRMLIPAGIKVKFPKGYCGLIVDKSGVASKTGLSILAKLIDEDYQGEIILSVVNTSAHPIKFTLGQKIVQMILLQVPYSEIVEVNTEEELFSGEVTERGEGGFGSTNETEEEIPQIASKSVLKSKKTTPKKTTSKLTTAKKKETTPKKKSTSKVKAV